MTFRDIVTNLKKVFQRKIKNPIQLDNDSNLESNLKFLKVDKISTPIQISEDTVNIQGSLNVNGSAVQTGTDAGATELNELSDVTYSSGDLTIDSLDKIRADDFVVDSGASIELDSHSGNFIAKKAGTEFSADNSAYAGMILGYTDIGLNEATATYNTTTSYVVPTTEFKVTFKIPPSGNVEISIQVMYDVGASNVADLYAGLSDGAIYNAVDDFHEVELYDAMSRGAIRVIRHSWTLTGLSSVGDEEQIWVGFKTSNTSGTPHLQWGGDASDEYPDFIMKAIALPATIAT